MPRPPLPRRVCCQSAVRGFRPIGRPACEAPVRRLRIDELEAVRLADGEGLYQDAAAERMGVSRQTFARILTRARATIASSLVEGAVLLIEPAPDGEDEARAAGSATAGASRATAGEAAGASSGTAPAAGPCPVHGGPRRRGRACRCHHP